MKCHLNGVLLAGGWWPNIKYWHGSFVNLQGTRTSIAKKPYISVIFQRGVPDLRMSANNFMQTAK